ncbi:MAG: nucleotidyltransferase domain-containing protein [Proteobacteria bacterium]|nr:nucleotidyltransferase domain-containing protein [Pseudomonadota bacterium]
MDEQKTGVFESRGESMMPTIPIKELLLAQPPVQFVYLEKLLTIFSVSPKLHSAYVRGSIARNDYDRVSDIDLVLAFEPEAFASAVESLDTIMQQSFSTLFSGWLDRIVPDFGGLGYVYLIQAGEKILQIDLYLLPSDRLNKLLSVRGVTRVYENNVKASSNSVPECNDEYIRSKISAPVTQESILFEIVVLAHLLKKRIKRGQTLLNHSETVMLHRAFRDLIRKTLDPAYFAYGWYHFSENSRKSEIFAKWAAAIETVVHKYAVHDSTSLLETMKLVAAFIDETCPEIFKPVGVSLNYCIENLRRGEL